MRWKRNKTILNCTSMENAPEKKKNIEIDFFKRYKDIFRDIKEQVLEQGYEILEAKKFTFLFLNRLIVVYFIQQIEWVYDDKKFMLNYLKKYKELGNNDSFYGNLLTKIFFKETAKGTLFKKHDVDELKIELSDDIMFKVIEEFLEKYNFTIREGTSHDLNGAITPAMLGKIYESLIVEEGRGKSGIFYTPRIQVDLMCRLGMYDFFLRDKYKILPHDHGIKEKLVDFVFTPLKNWNLEKKYEFEFLKKALISVKIVDPACGSGAFLVGMFYILLELYIKLGVKIDYKLKESIINNALHGVDVKEWAVRITEIRLWLKYIEDDNEIPKKRLLLPDFPHKLHSGDSLLQSTWELSYPDILLNGGFDIVITNPPYVRQEEIVDSSMDLEALNHIADSEKKKLKEKYKHKLQSQVSSVFDIKLSKKSDYYVYFFFKAIELASDTGVIVFLSSNSWLDVQFGLQLRQALLKNAHVQAIIENLSRRAFESADINTIITVLTKKKSGEQLSGNTRFISFFRNYEEILSIDILNEILTCEEENNSRNIELFNANLSFRRGTDFRIVSLSERDLWTLRTKWSKFLKAPEIYFKILDEYKDIFIRLGEIASFTYGEKTGANDFFFLGKPGRSHKYFKSKFDGISGNLNLYLRNDKYLYLFENFLVDKDEPIFTIEKEYWMRVLEFSNEDVNALYEYILEERNGTKWVPNYLIKSPKELNNIIVPPRELNKFYLVIPREESSLKEGIKKYIKWGESMEYQARPSCKRTPWYGLNLSAHEDVMCVELIHDRYFFANNKYKLLYDHTIYGFSFKRDSDINGAILNSTLIALFMEFEGRTTYGDGALGLMQYEYEALLTIKPEILARLRENDKKTLSTYFNGENNTSISSIFAEIGTTDPHEVKMDDIKPSRRKVDKIVFEKILNLSEDEQLEIYKSVVNLVKRRLEKAKRNGK